MAEVPTSGMMLRGRSPHRRRRYEKPQETPSESAPAETPGEPEKSPETGSSDVQEVPSDLTKVSDLLEWVGDNKVRAKAVLDQESAKPESEVRVTLVSKLTSMLEGDDLI